MKTIESYTIKRSVISKFRARVFKNLSELLFIDQEVFISKKNLKYLNALRVSIFDKFKRKHATIMTRDLDFDMFMIASYKMRVCSSFSYLIVLSLKLELNLIVDEMWEQKWHNTQISNNLYVQYFDEIIASSFKLSILLEQIKMMKKNEKTLIFFGFEICCWLLIRICFSYLSLLMRLLKQWDVIDLLIIF